MCGIVGIINSDGKPVEKELLLRMRDTMIHRGPDDCGIYIDNNIGLAHRRLSIIDLSEKARQPMTNEDGTLWLVYLGEIYNFKDLRAELISKGHLFKSQSDTEVIIHGYEEWGVDCISKLNGMFAFTLYDARRRQCLMVRDRLGIKPFYYIRNKDSFIFTSEIKALIVHLSLSRRLNRKVLYEYLVFSSVAGENTLLENVFELLPGHFLLLNCQTNEYQIEKYWDLYFRQEDIISDVKECVEKLKDLLLDSVKKRLISDVPLGIQLSGGVDSSTITAIASTITGFPEKTFSIGFKEKKYDESRYAQIVSQKYATDHYPLVINPSHFTEVLSQIIYYLDEPVYLPNSIAIYFLCKHARQNNTTVLLIGEGADELFAGYAKYASLNTYLNHKELIRRTPTYLLLKLLPERLKNDTLKTLGWCFTSDNKELIGYNGVILHRFMVSRFFSEDSMTDQDLSYRFQLYQKTTHINPLEAILYSDLKTHLVFLLNRQDKMSMASGVECRVPFLDHRIAELSARIPLYLKMNGRQRKVILKEVAKDFLPPEIIYRRKIGFDVPLKKWLKDQSILSKYLDVLRDGKTRNRGLFNYRYIDALTERCRKGKQVKPELIWTLTNLELWQRIFIDGKIPSLS